MMKTANDVDSEKNPETEFKSEFLAGFYGGGAFVGVVGTGDRRANFVVGDGGSPVRAEGQVGATLAVLQDDFMMQEQLSCELSNQIPRVRRRMMPLHLASV
jgi:hypothetical protein